MDETGDTQRARLAPQRRSVGQIVVARALWYVKPSIAELKSERLAPPKRRR